jgi:Phosphopantetheine attachment site
MAVVDSVHARLADLLSGMMGAVCGRPAPRAHLSFLALGGGEAEAAELAHTVNALFGVDLSGPNVMRSPTPDALARTIADRWFDGGGSAPDLVELIDAVAEAG